MQETRSDASSIRPTDSLIRTERTPNRFSTRRRILTFSEAPTRLQEILKRGIDVMVASTGLALFLLPMAIIALVIRATMGSPVIFRQSRPGLGGQPFEIYKFRTMNEVERHSGGATDDEERLGRVGRFLRSTSLDELPELVNVIKGDMSLVGPRPLLMEYLELYTPEQARRHQVRPGLTGWAQVNGRNAITWDEKFEHDIWYVDHWSLWLDLKILLLTPAIVLNGRGVSQPGRATVDRFKGVEGQDGSAAEDGAR